ncbi:MAG TPA: hypothetical protein VFV50_12545, partial [Bdellovibrionales bacterium]|nr:hypothetical protein [Bdellovibrionales bacterium]
MKVLLILAFFVFAAPARAEVVSKAHDIFFPPQLRDTFVGYQNFPVFWWNFLVLENQTLEAGSAVCERLRAQAPELGLARVECQQELADFREVAADWAFDLPRRAARPPDAQLAASLRSALAKASLPGVDRNAIEILRTDPLESWRELEKIASARLPIKLGRTNGFFRDSASGRILIPVQMSFPPSESSKTATLRESARFEGGVWVGPHWAALTNEERVIKDLNSVSIVGILVLAVFAVWLLAVKRTRLLYIVPPVLVATGLAALATVAVFGSIHGVTLSLGTAIVGLALDYGFHAALAIEQARVWRANFFGLLTTLAGLLILMCSEIPLLRQMMFFSSLGLVLAFTMLALMFRLRPGLASVRPLRLVPGAGAVRTGVAFALGVAGLIAFVRIEPALDLRRMEYQDESTRETIRWIAENSGVRPPLFEVAPAGPELLSSLSERRAWSLSQGISFESVANYLPPADTQRAHLASWRDDDCRPLRRLLSSEEWEFFSPFLDRACNAGGGESGERYIHHLESGGKWLSLWMPATPEHETLVRKTFPATSSLREIADIFPNTLMSELGWMAPLASILAAFIIYLHFRSIVLTAVALIPFICGLGLIAIMHWAFKLEFSFITLVGTIMIFGFSIDYGI